MFWKRKKAIDDQMPRFKQAFSGVSPIPVTSFEVLCGDELVENINVDFVYMIIEESDAQRFASCSSRSFEIAAAHNAMVVANAGGLIQLAVGDLVQRVVDPGVALADCAAQRAELACNLAQSLGTSVRIVHGRALSHIGYVGTKLRRNWGYNPIAFVDILQALLASTPGTPVDLGEVVKKVNVTGKSAVPGG